MLEAANTPRISREKKKKRTNRVTLRLQDIARVVKTIDEKNVEEQMKTMKAG